MQKHKPQSFTMKIYLGKKSSVTTKIVLMFMIEIRILNVVGIQNRAN